MSSKYIESSKNMEDFLKPLENIKQTEAPTFLYERIQQRIKNELENHVSVKTSLSMAAAFVVLISINAVVMLQQKPLKKENNLASSFQLMPDNNIYK